MMYLARLWIAFFTSVIVIANCTSLSSESFESRYQSQQATSRDKPPVLPIEPGSVQPRQPPRALAQPTPSTPVQEEGADHTNSSPSSVSAEQTAIFGVCTHVGTASSPCGNLASNQTEVPVYGFEETGNGSYGATYPLITELFQGGPEYDKRTPLGKVTTNFTRMARPTYYLIYPQSTFNSLEFVRWMHVTYSDGFTAGPKFEKTANVCMSYEPMGGLTYSPTDVRYAKEQSGTLAIAWVDFPMPCVANQQQKYISLRVQDRRLTGLDPIGFDVYVRDSSDSEIENSLSQTISPGGSLSFTFLDSSPKEIRNQVYRIVLAAERLTDLQSLTLIADNSMGASYCRKKGASPSDCQPAPIDIARPHQIYIPTASN